MICKVEREIGYLYLVITFHVKLQPPDQIVLSSHTIVTIVLSGGTIILLHFWIHPSPGIIYNHQICW
jgi:hypothetical protein